MALSLHRRFCAVLSLLGAVGCVSWAEPHRGVSELGAALDALIRYQVAEWRSQGDAPPPPPPTDTTVLLDTAALRLALGRSTSLHGSTPPALRELPAYVRAAGPPETHIRCDEASWARGCRLAGGQFLVAVSSVERDSTGIQISATLYKPYRGVGVPAVCPLNTAWLIDVRADAVRVRSRRALDAC